MGVVSDKLHLPPDILEGATIINVYGKEMALVENYKSIIHYSPEEIKLQGKHIKLLIQGENLYIERFTTEDCKIMGEIQNVQYIET